MKIKTKLMMAAIALVMVPMSLAIFLPSFILEREKQVALRNRLFVGLSRARKIIKAKSKGYVTIVMALAGSTELRSNLYVLKKYGTRLDQSIHNGFLLAIQKHLSSAMSGSEASFIAIHDADEALLTFVNAQPFDIDLTHLRLARGTYFAFVQDDLLLIAQRPITKDNQKIGSISVGMVVDLSFIDYLSEIIDLQITFHLKKGICLGLFCGENLASSEDALAANFPHIIGQKKNGEDTILLARDRYGFGYLIAGLSVGDLIKEKNKVTRILVAIALFSTIIAIGISFIWTKKSVVGPMHVLINGTRRVGRGELDTTFDIQTKDEIKELGDAFNEMTDSLAKYIKQLADVTATKERIESELKIAHDIQMGIMQKAFPPFPERHEFDIYATIEPAKDVGGDFYDFFLMGDDHIFFAVGDVSGKGVPAALFMAVSKTLIKMEATRGLTSAEVLTQVNRNLSLENPSLLFVTLFIGSLNIHTGELEYANGGHEPPFIIRTSGYVEPLELTNGVPLGVKEDFTYESKKLVLQKGDTVFSHTDGVTEAMNPEEHFFSEKRLQQTLARSKEKSITELIHNVQTEIEAFSKGTPQFDDITMLVLRFYGD